jgi:DNA-binding winged helix-turn-helix (wHTH) protein
MGSALSPLRDNVIFVGEWQLNIKQQTISDGVHTRELEPLLFKLLCFFIENNERIITRQELVENIWQQSFVDDNAINRAISELRKVLKSENQPGQTIKTHYRKGYSLFIAVRPLEQAPIAEPVVVANEETKPHLNTNTISEKTLTHRAGHGLLLP